MNNSKNFAILVDGENAGPKQFSGILREVQKQGTIAIKRVYADWTNPSRAPWKEVLHKFSARPIQQFNYGKEAADHTLIMDAVEVLIRAPEINAVCIVSSDNGFQFLAQRIREMGKYVMGVGRRESPARNLISACHDYVYFDNLDLPESGGDQSTAMEENITPDMLLKRAYLACSDGDGSVYLGDLGASLKKIDPAFDPRSYGFETLKRLVKGHSELFQIASETNDRCFIRLIESSAENTIYEMNGRLKRWIGNYGFIEAEDGEDYFFYKSNVVAEQRDMRFKSGQRFRFTVSKAPDPDAEPDTAARNGKAGRVVVIDG
ncbi:NYN domain-containing protein [Endozoicomonas lisbonensis]|uniref:Cold shock CspA family protein n=1 Tax=Endozoicomonas lisbonensis TaxID=3120522 RepID=A0ABV2SDW1_9GAMM